MLRLRDLTSSPAAFAAEADVEGMPQDILRRYGGQRVYASAGARAVAGRFPLVLFAQGNQQRPLHQAVLAEWLASHGFVVATAASTTIRSPMKTTADVGPAAQREAEQLKTIWQVMSSRSEVDARRVAVAGHSFGARAALLLAMREPALRALVSLDGGIGTATALESFRSAAWFSADAAVPPVLHLYETADAFMSPDFTLLESLRTRELRMRRVESLRHVHFTTLGFGAAADPPLAQLVRLEPGGRATLADLASAILDVLHSYLR